MYGVKKNSLINFLTFAAAGRPRPFFTGESDIFIREFNLFNLTSAKMKFLRKKKLEAR